MKFLSLARLFGARRRPARNGPRPPAARGKSHLPRLEELEERLAPALLIWTGSADIATNGGNNLWSTPSNWMDQQGVQRTPQTGDTLVFGAYTPPNQAQMQAGAPNTGTVFNDITTVPQLAAIYFNTPDWVLQGNPIGLSGDANGLGLVSNNVPGDADPATPDINVQLAVNMTASQTFQIRNGQARMDVSLLVRINSHTLTLDPEGGSVMYISGRLDDQLSQGFDPNILNYGFVPNSKLVKIGTGQAISSGTDNRYGGTTDIFNGVLWAASDTALGPSVFGTTAGIPGNTSIGTFVHPGGSLGIGSQVAAGGLNITEDIFLAGDGFQNLGALINVGSNPALGQPPVTNSLTGTVTLESPSGETLVNMLPGGTLDHVGGWKQPQAAQGLNAPHVQALTIFGGGLGAGGTLIMDGRGIDPFWGSTTTPFENLFFTNTYTGLTWVREGTLDLEKEPRENTTTALLINSAPTGRGNGVFVGGNYTSAGVDNLPTDPLLLNPAGGPPGGYAIMGNLTIGDAFGAPNSAAVRTIISEPSRDDPTTSNVEEVEDEQIKDTSTVVVNNDGLLDVRGYADPFRFQVGNSRPIGERVASLNVVGGNVLLEVNPNPGLFPAPVVAGAAVAPPAFIVGTLLTGNLVMQGGTISGQTAIDNSDGVPGEVLEGTLMLDGGGITCLASPTPAVINSLLDLGFQTRTALVIHGTSFPDLDIRGPVGNGGLVITASTTGGVVRMSNNNSVLTPTNVTFPAFNPNPYPPLEDPLNSDISVTLVSGTLLLSNDNAAGAGRLVIFGGSIMSDNPGRDVTTPVTIAGDFSFVGNSNITFSGQVQLQGVRTVTVGNLAATFSGSVVNPQGFSGGIFKTGPGILVFSGATPNTYTGTTWVRDGALLLTKSAGVVAVPGALYIGDDQGLPGSAVVGLYANGQIPSANGVVIASDGELVLVADVTQTFSSLQSSGAVVLGAGAGGPSLLTVNGATTLAGGSISTGPAGGSLQLGSDVRAMLGVNPSIISSDVTLTGPAVHNFLLDPGAVMAITGALSGNSGVYVIGAGTLVFGGGTPNTYTGLTWVQSGTLILSKNSNITAVPGTLDVGTGQGMPNSAAVGITVSQQIPTTSNVAVFSDGLLELGPVVTDFINTLFLAGTLVFDQGSHLFVHSVNIQPGAVIIDNSPGGLQAY